MIEISRNLIFIISGVNLLIILTLLFFIFLLNKKVQKLLLPGSENLEGSLIKTKENIENLMKFEADMREYLKALEKRVGRSIQAIETVRFTPFHGIGSGGNQSFSTAFVNEAGDGIVVSGLYYSRDRVSIFTKPIKKFLSEFDLTDEEKEALEKARKALE